MTQGGSQCPRPDVCELSQRLADGTTSSIEILTRCLDRIDQLDPVLNAFVALNRAARTDAEASDRRRGAGEPLSTIDGIPIATGFTARSTVLLSSSRASGISPQA